MTTSAAKALKQANVVEKINKGISATQSCVTGAKKVVKDTPAAAEGLLQGNCSKALDVAAGVAVGALSVAAAASQCGGSSEPWSHAVGKADIAKDARIKVREIAQVTRQKGPNPSFNIGGHETKSLDKVFAPSNNAIELLGPGVLETLRSGQNEQKYLDLLRYHVVYAELRSSDMAPGLTLMTWSSLTVEITDTAPAVRLNGEATVSQADIACSNGYVHILSRVARASTYTFPAPLKNIMQLAESESYLRNVALGGPLTGLDQDFADGRSEFALTVFLPTDTAFERLGLGIAASLRLTANHQRLTQLLKYHTVRGVYASSDLAFGQTLKRLEGTLITITSLASWHMLLLGTASRKCIRRPFLKATVLSRDVPATNGMIQLLDTVLLPTMWSYPDKTILQIVQASPNLSILRTALQKTDLAWIFASWGPKTESTSSCHPFDSW
eukprot:g6339.t1